uniref:ATP synthase subunit a n=1 Tax=Alcidodes juglans TaxID=2530216 RepID=A0A482DVT7_9CUCU|nr:ATP synthase F0 subunit 6 [Alcidodes juglans]QBM10382.1 ATP synthase F0 subunit 6 [Alcidodes juglans]
MMSSLFSSFDPSTKIFSLNWLSTFIVFFFIPSLYWFIPSRLNMLWMKIILTMHKEFKILIKNNKMKSSTLIFTSLFMFIMVNNFMGLFPYIFTGTSQMVMTLSLSFPLWLTFMLYGWIKNTNHMFIHLVPQGAPNILLPFLVIVESISNIIRPMTLAIRLMANMVAGHLLMTLLGNSGSMLSLYSLSLLIIIQILLLLLESAVTIIQAYVFSILITLYSSEIT